MEFEDEKDLTEVLKRNNQFIESRYIEGRLDCAIRQFYDKNPAIKLLIKIGTLFQLFNASELKWIMW